MCCCCECPLDLGCVDPCKCLDTLQVAESDGIYTLKYKFNGATLMLDQKFEKGEKLAFDIANLPGNYTFFAIVENPLCEPVKLVDLIEYDCLKFKTEQIINYGN